MEDLIRAPDPQALECEAEARRGKYLMLPWLEGEKGGGEGGEQEQQLRRQQQEEGEGGGGGSGGRVEVSSSFSPFARVAMVDGWASLRATEAVRVCVFV